MDTNLLIRCLSCYYGDSIWWQVWGGFHATLYRVVIWSYAVLVLLWSAYSVVCSSRYAHGIARRYAQSTSPVCRMCLLVMHNALHYKASVHQHDLPKYAYLRCLVWHQSKQFPSRDCSSISSASKSSLLSCTSTASWMDRVVNCGCAGQVELPPARESLKNINSISASTGCW